MTPTIKQILQMNAKQREEALEKTYYRTVYDIVTSRTLCYLGAASPDYKERVNERFNMILNLPDVVFWDFLEYHQEDTGIIKTFDSVIISTIGSIIAEQRVNGETSLKIWLEEDYEDLTHTMMGGTFDIKRAIASTFLPQPTCTGIAFKSLNVCFKNTISKELDVLNLKWVAKI